MDDMIFIATTVTILQWIDAVCSGDSDQHEKIHSKLQFICYLILNQVENSEN